MNLDQIEAEFEQYLIRCFGSTWERSGIMAQFKAAILKGIQAHGEANARFVSERLHGAAQASENLPTEKKGVKQAK